LSEFPGPPQTDKHPSSRRPCRQLNFHDNTHLISWWRSVSRRCKPSVYCRRFWWLFVQKSPKCSKEILLRLLNAMALVPCTGSSPYNQQEMECRNCGRKRLANKQALRAHLRWCPDRPTKRAADVRVENRGYKQLRSEAPQLFVPDTSIPLLDAPGISDFEKTALFIGIPSRAARVTANYVGFNGNLENPNSIWGLLQDCDEIDLRARRRLLRTWCSTNGIPLEESQMEKMQRKSWG